MNKDFNSEKLNTRLVYHTTNDKGLSCVEDVNPPIFVLPFIMDPDNKDVIKYLFLHEYKKFFFDEVKTSVLGIEHHNYDSNIDVVKMFMSKYFSIPESKIELSRIFYLGEMDVDISLFKTNVPCYGINLSGLLRNDEVTINLGNSENSKMIRVTYYDVLKGQYLDNMTMATTFQLMSYFML